MNKKKNEETLIEIGYHSFFVLLNGEKKQKMLRILNSDLFSILFFAPKIMNN